MKMKMTKMQKLEAAGLAGWFVGIGVLGVALYVGHRDPLPSLVKTSVEVEAKKALEYPKHLHDAILEVEGGPPENPACITEAYWEDAIEEAGVGADYETGRGDRNMRLWVMFWYAYRYEEAALRRGDVFVLACLHNGGWNWKNLHCADYGNRVVALVKVRTLKEK